MSNIFLEGTSSEDFFRKLRASVDEATGPLKQEVDELKKELRKSGRKTVSHRAAPIYFDNAITPERVLEYIHGRKLPEGAPGPLPAYKNGQVYYIKVEDIEAWQLGLATRFEDI